MPRTTAFLREMRSYLPDLDDQCFQPVEAAARIVRAGLQDGFTDERLV
ncbi:MAG: hypothetical protein GX173_01270 [Ruminococcaceae bacterium]|nr:hypothetical protein [Oscillospiraceae bacterium]